MSRSNPLPSQQKIPRCFADNFPTYCTMESVSKIRILFAPHLTTNNSH